MADQNIQVITTQMEHAFLTNVRTGTALRSFAAPVRGFKKRDCFQALHDYIYGPQQDRVFVLFGLQRTGKTTMIRQILSEMTDAELAETAFIQITAKDTLAIVNQDLKYLESVGFRYRHYDKQYQHQADYSFADTDYVTAHSVKLGESPESVLIRREAYAALENALRALSDEQRRRLLLRTEEDWTFEQIAAAEGVSADAVRHQFERTIKRLRALMQDWLSPEPRLRQELHAPDDEEP